MLNKYLASDVVQKWSEDFIDEDTKEVVSVERTQKLFDRGRLIDQDLLTQINFHLQTGDIKEVEVSNQKRLAFENKNTFLHPWQAQAEIGDKKYKFLLYASGISNVIEILNDYIELNYASGFTLVMAKEIDSCIILTDNFEKQKVDLEKAYLKDEISLEEYVEAKDGAKDEDEEIKEKKFYQLEVKITYSDNIETTQSFIVHTFDTDRALMVISHYLKKWEEKKNQEHREKGWSEHEIRDFKLCIEKAGPMPVGAFVPKEFSLAYNEQQ
ncbi:MAG: RNA polymerase subunit sigma [Rikenellaceae bacterium]|nr:RNA polymerase subunit sigma [Rikenellaceae bacterium]